MVEIIWTEPALAELDAIADYIALEDVAAAEHLVQRIFFTVERLARFPKLGSRIREWPQSPYRHIIVSPCRILYRIDRNRIYVVFVMRQERPLRKRFLKRSN